MKAFEQRTHVITTEGAPEVADAYPRLGDPRSTKGALKRYRSGRADARDMALLKARGLLKDVEPEEALASITEEPKLTVATEAFNALEFEVLDLTGEPEDDTLLQKLRDSAKAENEETPEETPAEPQEANGEPTEVSEEETAPEEEKVPEVPESEPEPKVEEKPKPKPAPRRQRKTPTKKVEE